MSWKLLYTAIITYPYFHMLFVVWLRDGAVKGVQRESQDLPLRDEVAGYVQSDKLMKIERAQRR